MSNRLGYFGYDAFGAGYFGYCQTAIPVSASIISQQLKDTLAQDFENEQEVTAIVEVAGIDVTEYITYLKADHLENTITSKLDLTFYGELPSVVAEEAEIKVKAYFKFADGSEFSNQIFSGKIKFVQPSTGKTESASAYAYDDFKDVLAGNHKLSSWNGSAIDLISLELSLAGVLSYRLDFEDYNLNQNLSYTNLKELINAVAGGQDEVMIFGSPDGSFNVLGLNADFDNVATLTKKSYYSVQQQNDTGRKLKTINLQGSDGTPTTYTDKTVSGGETDYSSAVLTSVADLQTKGAAIVDKSQRVRRVIQLPCNPLLHKGRKITITHSDDTVYHACIVQAVHYIEWNQSQNSPGANTYLILEVLS